MKGRLSCVGQLGSLHLKKKCLIPLYKTLKKDYISLLFIQLWHKKIYVLFHILINLLNSSPLITVSSFCCHVNFLSDFIIIGLIIAPPLTSSTVILLIWMFVPCVSFIIFESWQKNVFQPQHLVGRLHWSHAIPAIVGHLSGSYSCRFSLGGSLCKVETCS